MLAAHLFGAIVAVLALTGARGDSVLCSDSAPTSVYFYVPHRMRNDPKASDFQGAMQQLGNAVFRGDGKVTFSYNVYDGTQTNQVGTATDASAFGGLVTFGDAQTYDDTQSIYHPLGHFNSVVSSPSDTRFQAVIFTYDNDTTSNPQQIIDLRNQIEAKHAVITTVVMRSPLQWTPPYSSVPTDTFVYTGHKFNDTVMALASSSPVTAHMHIVDDMEAFYYGYATRLGASLYAFSSVESQVYGDGSCTVFGDPHVITPTGHMYSFQGYGTYDLLRPLKPNGGGHRLRVEAMFGPCAFPSVASDVNSGADGAYYGWTKATCLNGVAFTNGQDVMEVRYRGSETFLMVRMNGIEMPSWEYAWGNQAHTIGMKIMTAAKGPEKAAGGPTGIGNTGLSGDGTEMIALAYFKDGNDYVTLEVAFAQNGAALRMWPSPSLQTRVGGLCGSFSRCRAKDLVSSSGLMVSSPVSLEKAEGPNFHPMPSNHPDPFKYDVGRSDQLSLMAGYHQRLYDFAQSWKVTDGETIFFNLPAERQIVPQQFTPDINPNAPSSTGVCNGLTGWLLWVCQYDVKTTGRSELAWASTWIAEHVCADYCQFGRRQRGGSFVAADIQLIDPTSCACRDFEDLDLHTGYGSSNLPPHMLEGVTLPHAFARLPLGGTYKFERYPGGQQVELKVACHQVVGVANAGDDFTVARSSFFTSPYTGTERDNNYVKLRGSASTVIQRQFQFSWRLVNYTPLQGGEAELPYAGDIRFVVSPVVHGENRRVAHFKPRYPGVYEWELALYDGCRITTDRVKVTVACPSCTTKAAFKAPPTANLLWTGKSFETDFYVPVPTSALPFVRYSIARPATPMTEMADGVTASGDLEVRHDVSACHEENLKSTSVGVGTSSMSYTLVRVLDTCATSTGPNVPVSYTQIHPSDASGEFSTKLVAQYPTRSFDNMGITYEHWHYSTYNLANWNVTMKDQLIEELCDITMSYSMESNITSSWKRAAIPAQVHVTATPRSGDPKDCMAHYNFVATMWDGCQFSTVDQTQTMVMPRCPSRSIARINCSDADTTVFYGQGNPGYKPVMLTADQTFTSSLSYSVQKLNYEWKVTQAPEASLMLGTKWTGQAVSFIPDVDGEYIITLYADDGCSVGIQDTIKITAHCNQDTALTSTVTMSAPTFTDGMTITTDPSGPTDNLRTVYKWFFNTTSQSVMNPYSVRIPPATSSQWPSTLLNGNGLYGAKVYLQNGCQGIVKTVQNTLSATPPTLSYNFLKSRYTFQVDTGAYEMIKAKPTFSSSSFVYTDSYFNITYTDGNHGTLAATFDGDNWVGQPMNAGVYTLVLSGNDTKNFVSAAQTSTEVGCFDYPDPAIHYNVTHDGDTTEDGDIFPGDVVVFNIRVANEPFSHPLRFQKYEWTLVSADGKVVWNQISSSPTASFNAETPGDYVMQTRAALPSQCLPPKFLTEYLPGKEYSVFTNYDFPAYNTSFTVKCGRTPVPSYNLASETSLSTSFDGARFPGVTLANVGSSSSFFGNTGRENLTYSWTFLKAPADSIYRPNITGWTHTYVSQSPDVPVAWAPDNSRLHYIMKQNITEQRWYTNVSKVFIDSNNDTVCFFPDRAGEYVVEMTVIDRWSCIPSRLNWTIQATCPDKPTAAFQQVGSTPRVGLANPFVYVGLDATASKFSAQTQYQIYYWSIPSLTTEQMRHVMWIDADTAKPTIRTSIPLDVDVQLTVSDGCTWHTVTKRINVARESSPTTASYTFGSQPALPDRIFKITDPGDKDDTNWPRPGAGPSLRAASSVVNPQQGLGGVCPDQFRTWILTDFAPATSAVSPTPAPQPLAPAPQREGGLAGGAVAGIVAGVVVGLGVAGFVTWFVVFRKRRSPAAGSSRSGVQTGSGVVEWGAGSNAAAAGEEDVRNPMAEEEEAPSTPSRNYQNLPNSPSEVSPSGDRWQPNPASGVELSPRGAAGGEAMAFSPHPVNIPAARATDVDDDER